MRTNFPFHLNFQIEITPSSLYTEGIDLRQRKAVTTIDIIGITRIQVSTPCGSKKYSRPARCAYSQTHSKASRRVVAYCVLLSTTRRKSMLPTPGKCWDRHRSDRDTSYNVIVPLASLGFRSVNSPYPYNLYALDQKYLFRC